MNETERRQLKGALLKCAKENEHKVTPTCYVIVSSVCRAAVERIEELEKENAELKEHHKSVCETLTNTHRSIREQLTKAIELLKETQGYIENNDDVLYDEIEQFIREI